MSLESFRLVVFRTVAHRCSFSRAAEELLLTQPAVTQQIKALEEEFGVPLFLRAGGRIALSPAGEALLPFTYLPRWTGEYQSLNGLGKAGLTATLFLIGTSLSKKTLHAVGLRPFLHGVALWVAVGTVSLLAIARGGIVF